MLRNQLRNPIDCPDFRPEDQASLPARREPAAALTSIPRWLALSWIVLSLLLSACNDQYGVIGPASLSRAGISGGEMSLFSGVPGGAGNADGVSDRARFNAPWSVAAVGGNLYIADRENHTIRKLNLSTGGVITLAGLSRRAGTANGRGRDARFNAPEGVAITPDGAFLYVADTGNHAIRRIDLNTLDVVTLAGRRGQAGSLDSSNGRGDSATFRGPAALAVWGGNLYVTDSDNHLIRRVDPGTGETVTLAGTARTPGLNDGTGAAALFNTPLGIVGTQDSQGDALYIADSTNHLIRRLDLTTLAVTSVAGTIATIKETTVTETTVAGNTATVTKTVVTETTVDGNTTTVTETTVTEIPATTATVAGTTEVTVVRQEGVRGFQNAPVPALQARFFSPRGITFIGGKLYISDPGNYAVRELDTLVPATVRTVAGTNVETTTSGTIGLAGSGDGIKGTGRFNFPAGLTSWNGSLYVADGGSETVRRVDPGTGDILTLAGKARHAGIDDGPLGTGRFWNPLGIAVDGPALYVADTATHIIRKVDRETGEITTLAGEPGFSGNTDSTISPAFFNGPRDIAVDGAEKQIFIVDTGNHAIRRMFLSTGQVETFVGTRGLAGSSDGVAFDARFRNPQGIARIGDVLYLADTGNHTLRKIDIVTRQVSTVAGHPGTAGQADGVRGEAYFNAPQDITTDGIFLYVADTANHAIRRVDPDTGEVTTVVGVPGQAEFVDSVDGDPRLRSPGGVLYHDGFLYISDTLNYAIRKVDLSTGAVSLLAGDRSCNDQTTTQNGTQATTKTCTGTPTGVSSFTDSTDGTGKTASFLSPAGLEADDRYLYVMDSGNHTLRRVDQQTGETASIAGGNGFADGPGGSSRFNAPVGVYLIGAHLYFTDSGNHLIRLVDLTSRDNPGASVLDPSDPCRRFGPGCPVVSTLAGNVGASGSANVPGYQARFNSPSGVAADGQGNLYVADTGSHTIRKVDIATGKVTTVAGVPGTSGYVNSEFGIPLFNAPTGIIWDNDHLYIADTGNHLIRRVTLTTGRVSLVAGHADERTGVGTAGTEDSTGQAAGFNAPQGITSDDLYLYVADTGNHTVRRVLKATGEVRTIAGMPREPGSLDDIGFNARLNSPRGLVSDGNYVYVADSGNNLLRRLDKRNRELLTFSGLVRQSSFSPGPRDVVRFNQITGITTTPDSPYLYVVDTSENAIGRVTK